MKRIYLVLALFMSLVTAQAQSGREHVLKVCNWDEYIGPGLVEEFEAWYQQQTGIAVKVEYDTFDYPEEGLQRIVSGEKDYDVFCPPEYLVERMLRHQLLQKIDTCFSATATPNWLVGTSAFVDSVLQRIGNAHGVQTKDYAVGYLWGNTGVLVNTKYVSPEEVSSWAFLFDRRYRNKVVMKDSFSDLYNLLINYAKASEVRSGLISRNLLASSLTNENIAIVEDLLQQARPQMTAFEVDDDKRLMADGSHWLSVTWNGDAKWAIDEAAEGVSLQYIIPKEGSDCWIDCWVIPSSARNVRAASYWINFLCRSENALRCMEETGYSSAIGTPEVLAAVTDDSLQGTVDLSYFFGPEAVAVCVDSVMYPDRSIIDRCSLLRDCGDRQEVMREIWERVKATQPFSPWPYVTAGGAIVLLLLLLVYWRRKAKLRKKNTRDKHAY